jgi:hypothetical protein
MHHIGHERKQIQDITMPVVHELKQSLHWEMFKNLESMLKIKETFTFWFTNLHIETNRKFYKVEMIKKKILLAKK